MNFILYEDEQKYIEFYKNSIYKLLGPTNINFKILEINKYDEFEKKIEKLEGNKIYILDIEVPGKNGIELARKIRKSGDWLSPIIVVTSHEEFKQVGYTGKILMLNFISKMDNIEKDLYETLDVALEINLHNPSFSFINKGELYQILYSDILYIEKSLNNNNSIIVTKENNVEIRKTINSLEKELSNNVYFFKTHRSCIVNLKNITHIDFENNIISFKDKKIDLLSRANKKKLKEKLKDVSNDYSNT